MKLKYDRTQTVEVDAVCLSVCVPADEIDNDECYEGEGRFPASFQQDNGDYYLVIDIETGVVAHWPNGLTVNAYFKPRDSGSYAILGRDGEVLAEMVNEYVPECFGWNDCGGDYLSMHVQEDGRIVGFKCRVHDVAEFLEEAQKR